MNKVLLLEKWHKQKGSEPWTIDDIAELIAEASNIGEEIGERTERERIINLLNTEASEWLSHDGMCDCKVRGQEVLRLIEKIEESK